MERCIFWRGMCCSRGAGCHDVETTLCGTPGDEAPPTSTPCTVDGDTPLASAGATPAEGEAALTTMDGDAALTNVTAPLDLASAAALAVLPMLPPAAAGGGAAEAALRSARA